MLKPNESGEGGTGTTVGANVVLTGTIKDVNDIVVYGKVEGEVISEKSIFIGEGAQVKGPITAHIVTVSGKVKGSVEAHEKIELTSSAKIYGSITTKDLIIQSGAVFVGKSMMPDHEAEIKAEKEKEEKEGSTEEKQEEKEAKKSAETEDNSPKYEVE